MLFLPRCFIVGVAMALWANLGLAYDIRKSLGDVFTPSAAPVAPDQNRLVIFRAPDATNAASSGVVTVYLGDKYHVSLQANAYTVVCLEGERIDIRTRLTPTDAEPLPELDTRHPMALEKGATQYLRIRSAADGRTQLQEIPLRIAQDELQNARQQLHTRSRAPDVRACKPQPVRKADQAAEPRLVTFGFDADFEYKKSDLRGLTPDGQRVVRQLVEKINKQYAQATKVDVQIMGFADDSINTSYNERLAKARSRTLKTYLLQHGLRETEITEAPQSTQNPPGFATKKPHGRYVQIGVSLLIPS